MDFNFMVNIGCVIVIALGCIVRIVFCLSRYQEDINLNNVVLNPPADGKTLIRSVNSVVLTKEKIISLLRFAMLYARADFRLAETPEEYEKYSKFLREVDQPQSEVKK